MITCWCLADNISKMFAIEVQHVTVLAFACQDISYRQHLMIIHLDGEIFSLEITAVLTDILTLPSLQPHPRAWLKKKTSKNTPKLWETYITGDAVNPTGLSSGGRKLPVMRSTLLSHSVYLWQLNSMYFYLWYTGAEKGGKSPTRLHTFPRLLVKLQLLANKPNVWLCLLRKRSLVEMTIEAGYAGVWCRLQML